MKSFMTLSFFTLLQTALAKPLHADVPETALSPQFRSGIMNSEQVKAVENVAIFNNDFQDTVETKNAVENGLLGPCKDVTLIYARGTTEVGNIGGIFGPGPAWIAELRKYIGDENIAVQGVDYKADVLGYLSGGDPEGSQRYFDLTYEAAKKCPDTKIVIGGYSQGAQLTHNAANRFSDNLTSRIVAGVVFGDPFYKKPLGSLPSSAVLSICHWGDIICNGYGGATNHLNYAKDATRATAFVLSKLKQQGKESPVIF